MRSIDADNTDFLSRSWLFRVKSGRVSGYRIVDKFGANAAVGATAVPICDGGVYQTPTSAQSLEVVSSSADDTLAGTGARRIRVQGLDANYLLQELEVDMNGTTPVAVPGTWTRVFRLRIVSGYSGTYATASTGSHAGTITVRGAGAGATWGTIPLLSNLGDFPAGASLIGAYSIPANERAYLLSKKISVEATRNPSVGLFSRAKIDDVTTGYEPMVLTEIDVGLDSGSSYNPPGTFGPYEGPCDIGFMGRIPTGTAAIEVDFALLLEEK